MNGRGEGANADRADVLAQLRQEPCGAALAAGAAWTVGDPADHAPAGGAGLVLADYLLQDEADYRAALQRWFAVVREGGQLAVLVPHAFLYERQLGLPSRRRPRQRRLYTPASLMGEVEEALVPNSYRVRWLGDRDQGYDYSDDGKLPPTGAHDVLLIVERIAQPAWLPTEAGDGLAEAPDFAFEPGRTRLEIVRTMPRRRILILKLDHLGDFIMGVPALEKLRMAFPEADITLVVGSWNEAMARGLGFADTVIAFDLYPRNSSEEEVDVRGKTALFDRLIQDSYDLAIDLRTDPDTRFLLRNVRAAVRAGMGTKAEFPHLDIFLPVDISRHEPESAREDRLSHHDFASQSFLDRNDYYVAGMPDRIRHDMGALVWGPYRPLRAGDYIFEPFLEVDDTTPGILSCDVALDAKWRSFVDVTDRQKVRLAFTVERPHARFEFRIWPVVDQRPLAFRFFGGRLIRRGASSVLHQSEYLLLLVELIAMRVSRAGMLQEQDRLA